MEIDLKMKIIRGGVAGLKPVVSDDALAGDAAARALIHCLACYAGCQSNETVIRVSANFPETENGAKRVVFSITYKIEGYVARSMFGVDYYFEEVIYDFSGNDLEVLI